MPVTVRPYAQLHNYDAPGDYGWTIPQLCWAYNWPKGDAPGGGTIGIVELGGGWNFADVVGGFDNMGLPAPTIFDVSVDGTRNAPGAPADAEVALDIQAAGMSYAVATGKPANIRVYWCQDIAAGVRAAAADGCDVFSISWGNDEALWGAADALAIEAEAIAATAAGMVVFAAAGDNDSSDGGATPANVDLPASAPHVIACGGTSKWRSGVEVVWNNYNMNSRGAGTGGGYSTLFPAQPWQTAAGVPTAPLGLGRMVPDVAACADPNTGVSVMLNGNVEIIGGTSGVAPLYAGLVAAAGKKLGFITPKLYASKDVFVDITRGNNGTYVAEFGCDACTGLGVPNGARLVALLT